MNKEFNQKEYNAQYDKEHYKQFKAKIKNEEMDKINGLLNKKNMNKTEFIKKSYFLLNLEILKESIIKIMQRYSNTSFDLEYNFKNKNEETLNNGITFIKNRYPVLNEFRYLIQIKWKNYFLYSTTVNPKYIETIKNELELLNTSDLKL